MSSSLSFPGQSSIKDHEDDKFSFDFHVFSSRKNSHNLKLNLVSIISMAFVSSYKLGDASRVTATDS